MPVKKNIPLTCFLLLFFISWTNQIPVYSQEDECKNKIQEAREYYEQGQIDRIPDLLMPCIEEGFTRTQKMEAYKLLILAYLFDFNQAEAEKNMVEFLKKYPEYEISPNDPVEFVYLFESYRTTDVFSVGITAGFNITDPRIIEPFTALDYNIAKLKNTPKGGFQLGLGIARYISLNMLVNLELNFVQNQYSFTDKLTVPVINGTDIINVIVYNEKLNKIEIPVTLAYEFYIRKINFFLRSGTSFSRIMGTKAQASRKYAKDILSLSSEYMDVQDSRKKMLYGFIIGGGIRYKVPRGVILIDLRANFGINNIVKTEERYKNSTLLSKYYYIDDDFSLNVFSISAGYYFSFYTPSKK